MNQDAQETPTVGTLRKLMSGCDADFELQIEAAAGCHTQPLRIEHLRFRDDGAAVILRLRYPLLDFAGELELTFEKEQRQMIKEEQQRAELQDKAQAEMQANTQTDGQVEVLQNVQDMLATSSTPIYDSLMRQLAAAEVQLDRTYEQAIAAVTYQMQLLSPPLRLEFIKAVREILTGGEVRLTEAGYTLPVDKQVEAPAAVAKQPPKLIDGFPRRNQMNYWSPIEKAIWDAKQAVEAGPAHPFMTDATILLGQAQDKVADYYERPSPTPEEQKMLMAALLLDPDDPAAKPRNKPCNFDLAAPPLEEQPHYPA